MDVPRTPAGSSIPLGGTNLYPVSFVIDQTTYNGIIALSYSCISLIYGLRANRTRSEAYEVLMELCKGCNCPTNERCA